MKFIVYWKHGKSNIIEGDDIANAFTIAGYGAGAVAAIDFYSNGEEHTHVRNKATNEWVPKIALNADKADEVVVGRTCYQFMQWVFKDLYLGVFKSFDPMGKHGSAKELSNGEIRRLFEKQCIEINGDFFEAQEPLPPFINSIVLFPKNQRMRNTLI